MFRKFILLLVSTIVFYSGAIFAVGLGDYSLKSGLNQPLKAEIKLLSAGDLGEHEVHASLASAKEFEKVGVQRLFGLTNIGFETKKQPNGSVIINLTTQDPIKEPFLNFLVELNWPNGRIIREYTFLLDPPIFEESTASTIEKTKTQVAKKKTNQVSGSSTRQNQVSTFNGTTTAPVSSSDTLWSIANKTRPSSQVTIHQTLVAIYRANPDAFSNGNINNLLRGKVLKIPDAESIAQVPHRAALQDVVMQNNQWQSGGARQITDNASNTASTKINNEGRLTLASPKNDGKQETGNANDAQEQLKNAQNQLAQSQEVSATLQTENDELRTRLADALKKLELVQSDAAVNVSDTELAVLTNNQTSTENQNIDEGENNISNAVDNNQNLANAPTNETLGSDTQETAEQNSADEAVTPQASTTPATPVFVPKPEKSLWEEVTESGGLLWGSIGFIVLVVLAVFWRMRQRMEEDDFHDGLVASAGASNTESTESFELPDVGDDMLVELDMEEEEQAKESDEENFDPLGEADIYIAYGKYEQAESLLLGAIDDNPVRSDLKVKLMECYAENGDKDKFESLAQEVSQAVDAEEWLPQVNHLREQAWSDEKTEEEFNLPSTEDIFNEDDFDLDDDEGEEKAATKLTDDTLTDDASDDEFDIDLDMNLEEEIPASEAATETMDSLEDEFSIDNIESDETFNEAELDDEETIELDDSDDISLDFDDEGDFSFDDEDSNFDNNTIGDDSAGDEISTKLDLARAYIDMGDADGAKEILSEVLSEGTDAQKQEAQSLLNRAE